MEEKIYYIYGHEHEGKWYVGQTIRKPEVRWGKAGYHYLRKKDGYYKHPKFARAIKEFGWENFDHVILETTDDFTKLNDLELKWMIEKDSIENGYNNDPRKLPKTLDMRSTRKRMALASPSKKKVVMCDGNTGENLLVFETMSFAAEFVGLKNYSTISKVIRGEQIYAGGFKWVSFDENIHSTVPEHRDEKINDFFSNISGKYKKVKYHKHVSVISHDGIILFTFEDVDAASNILRIPKTTIIGNINKKTESEAGFKFSYNTLLEGKFQDYNKEKVYDILNVNKNKEYIFGMKKKVAVFAEKNSEILKIFDSAADAGHFIGRYNGSWIADACRTGKKTFGFFWKYLERDKEYEHLDLSKDDLLSYCKPKKVAKYSLDGELLGVYKNITDAAKSEDIKRKMVSNCCNNKQKTSAGFKWSFIF